MVLLALGSRKHSLDRRVFIEFLLFAVSLAGLRDKEEILPFPSLLELTCQCKEQRDIGSDGS